MLKPSILSVRAADTAKLNKILLTRYLTSEQFMGNPRSPQITNAFLCDNWNVGLLLEELIPVSLLCIDEAISHYLQ